MTDLGGGRSDLIAFAQGFNSENSDSGFPTCVESVSVNYGMQIEPKDRVTVAIAAARNARDSCAGIHDRLNRCSFQYIALIVAMAFAGSTEVMSETTPAGIRLLTAMLPVFTGTVAIASILRFSRQLAIVYAAYIDIERSLECYEVGAYVDGTTLLPPAWDNSDGKYVGMRQHLTQLAAISLLSLSGFFIIYFG